MSEAEVEGGRIFFSSKGRTLEGEDEIVILSVGVDIGSSTSHLVFSRIVLERLDSRYVVTTRETFYESDILLTPYTEEETIDADRLGAFIAKQYDFAKVQPDEIDTGALILTGVAVRRKNARAIGDLFASQTGKLVAVSAGDSLETVMAAYGSGAVQRSSRDAQAVMNIDIGGGTSKIAICANGKVVDLTAVDVGARLVVTGADGRVTRTEEAGRQFAAELGIDVTIGSILKPEDAGRLARRMTERLFDAMQGKSPTVGAQSLLRLDPIGTHGTIGEVTISGGVSEFVYGREKSSFGDLGPLLATEMRTRIEAWGPRLGKPAEGIRATVVGASQYTTQVSGSTIYVWPLDVLPLRNVPVIAPEMHLEAEEFDPKKIAAAILGVLKRLDLADGEKPVALFAPWRGSATFARLDAFCEGVIAGLEAVLARGHPIVLVGDGDVGGLVGIHFREEMKQHYPIVSIDGLELKEFDYIDIGALLDTSGAVPVVIKSLIFPSTAALGKAGTKT
jgi:ethanolamine utilization protein EutA